MGYYPFSAMCRDWVPRVATKWSSSAHDSARSASSSAHDMGVCARATEILHAIECMRVGRGGGPVVTENPCRDRLPIAPL